MFLVQSSLWSSIFAFFEEIRYGKAIRMMPPPDDPIFIIGHWRTGSTLLHQLMNLDPELSAPTLFEVALPDSFLTSYPYYKPVMKWLVDKFRPMDMVKLGMDEPQEDEYAIYRICRFSPLESLVFPKSKEYFLNRYDTYIPANDELVIWKEQLIRFYTRLFYKKRKTIVSKNPFNSFRIPLLISLFPKSRFIHIVRHPYDVVPSTIRMWDIVQQQNCLNSNAHRPTISEVVKVMDRLFTNINKDRGLVPSNRYTEVKFEELEKDPRATLQKIYQKFGLPFSIQFEKRLISFLDEVKSYKKNQFLLTEDEKATIRDQLTTFMQQFDYV